MTPFSKIDLPKNPPKPAASGLSTKVVWITCIGLAQVQIEQGTFGLY